MGHQDKVRKLNKTKPHREAMLDNMTVSLLTHRLIRTTDAKAKVLRPVVDRLITIAKEGTLASKRRVAQVIRTRELFTAFYNDILPQLSDRNSGYTRVMKLGTRRGDGTAISVVELMIPKPVVVETDANKGKGAKAAAGEATAKAAKAPRPPKEKKAAPAKKEPKAKKAGAKPAKTAKAARTAKASASSKGA